MRSNNFLSALPLLPLAATLILLLWTGNSPGQQVSGHSWQLFKNDTCDCSKKDPEFKKIHFSSASCFDPGDENKTRNKIAQRILNKIAQKLTSHSAASARVIAENMTSSLRYLLTVFANFEYRCCEDNYSGCKWKNKKKKIKLEGPVDGCFILPEHTSEIHAATNNSKKEIICNE